MSEKYEDKLWLFNSFEMPNIWYNEEEIYNLIQSFKRPRYIDPNSYDLKMNFWSNLILKYAEHHHILIINVQQLESLFIKEFKSIGISLKPQCLSTVFEHLINEGKLIEISKFEGSRFLNKFVSSMGWILTKPLTWSYQKISSVFYTENVIDIDNHPVIGNFVLNDVAKKCENVFMNWLTTIDVRVSPRLDVLTESDLDFLLTQFYPDPPSRSLARKLLINHHYIEIISLPSTQKESNIEYGKTTNVIKFATSANQPLPSSSQGLDKGTIDQIIAIVQLRELINKLTTDEAVIENKVNKIRDLVKSCLRAGKKEEAKNHLKHCKTVEKTLERKRIQSQNVEKMLLEIESSSDNMKIVKALSDAAGALKAQSMDVNIVQDVMAEIGDVLAEQEEINASISGLGDTENNDIAELEQELDDLMLNRNISLKIEEDLVKLPDVPTHNISPIMTKGTLKAFN